MRAVVFGGADIKDYGFCSEYLKDSIVVCCDGGMKHALSLGIIPDVIVGDFDSVDSSTAEYFEKKNVPVHKFPTHKDETDMELGCEAAIQMGADELILIGGIGSRMDHTMGNCQFLVRLLKEGIKAYLVNENNFIFVTEDRAILKGEKGSLVSIFPVGMEAEGVTTKNLEYPLDNAVLSCDSRLIAVSNVMTDTEAEITVKKGMLYIMQCKD